MIESIALELLRDELQEGGLVAGLAMLNRRVSHRFTAVYQLDGDVLRNVAIVDKLGEIVPANLLAVPLRSSFCQFVLRDGVFATTDPNDERLDGHPFKGVVNAYVGLPLSRPGDDLFGTFCHFDFPPQNMADEEFDFMRKAAKELPRHLPVLPSS